MFNTLYRENADLKVKKTKNYDSWIFYIVDINWLELQIKQLQTSRKDQELDEERKEVENLKNMLQEANKRESTLTRQLKEKEKSEKWNKYDKEHGKKITTLKGELE